MPSELEEELLQAASDAEASADFFRTEPPNEEAAEMAASRAVRLRARVKKIGELRFTYEKAAEDDNAGRKFMANFALAVMDKVTGVKPIVAETPAKEGSA